MRCGLVPNPRNQSDKYTISCRLKKSVRLSYAVLAISQLVLRHYMKRRVVVFLGLLLLVGCTDSRGKTDVSDRKLRVVTTTTMIADAARIIGGERVEVDSLMRPGVDPHTHQPSAGDAGRMRSADLVLYNGLHLEGKMGAMLEEMSGRVKSVAITAGMAPHELRPAPAGFEGGTHDPHVWFDVRLWKKGVECIRDALIEVDPTHATRYRANADSYLTQLDQLHQEVQEKAARVSPERRKLVTAHDAFYYFGQAYGFEVHGLQGVSTEAKARIEDVQRLARFIADQKIPAVFVEQSVNPKNIEALREAVMDKGHQVAIGGELFSDSLDDLDKPAGTYVGMIRHNIDTIVQALAR